MTPMEFDFLKTFLKTRSGLVLSNDKQYLVENGQLKSVPSKPAGQKKYKLQPRIRKAAPKMSQGA